MKRLVIFLILFILAFLLLSGTTYANAYYGVVLKMTPEVYEIFPVIDYDYSVNSTLMIAWTIKSRVNHYPHYRGRCCRCCSCERYSTHYPYRYESQSRRVWLEENGEHTYVPGYTERDEYNYQLEKYKSRGYIE